MEAISQHLLLSLALCKLLKASTVATAAAAAAAVAAAVGHFRQTRFSCCCCCCYVHVSGLVSAMLIWAS
jgi:hypothetical protein